MGIPVEYFKNQTHITDLLKLKDNELYSIIRLFYDELAYFNDFDGFQLKGLITACNETKDLIKDIRFILNGYIDVIDENDLSFRCKTDIERILSVMDEIELHLTKIKAVRLLKKTVNGLVKKCLLNIRILYTLIDDFIFYEKNLWVEC